MIAAHGTRRPGTTGSEGSCRRAGAREGATLGACGGYRRRGGEGAMAFAVVGQSIVRDEGPAKVTGAARYTADVPLPARSGASACAARCPTRASCASIRAAPRACRACARCSPARTSRPASIGRRLKDQPIVARDRVRFVGERVAAVAADRPRHRRGGARADRRGVRGAARGVRPVRGDGARRADPPPRPAEVRGAPREADDPATCTRTC